MTTSSQDINWIDRVESLFLRFGIKSITMDDVAADLGISKKTLYQMVESKDELVIKVLEQHISREKAKCIELAAKAPNALEEIFIILDSNSQEMAQMKTNIVNDLQKYHRAGWELIQKFHFDFVFKVIRENLLRGRAEGLYREDFDIDILAKLHLAAAFNMFDPQLFPDSASSRLLLLKEYMMHYLHGIVSPQGLAYLKKKLS
jgi:AcrR family transcriptional regulator